MVLGVLAALGVMRVGAKDVAMTDVIRHQTVLILNFAAAGCAEELLNRGYVLRTLSDGLGFGTATLLTSAFFAWCMRQKATPSSVRSVSSSSRFSPCGLGLCGECNLRCSGQRA